MANNNPSYEFEEEDEGEETEEEEEETEEEEADEEDGDFIPLMRVTRVSQDLPSSSAQSIQSIVVEEHDNEEEESGDLVNQISENGTEIIQEEEDRRIRRREEGEASSSSKVESEGTNTKRMSSENNVDGLCCTICMEPWTSEGDHQVSCLPCGHIYGTSCIKRWIQQCGKSYGKCPQCNKKCILKEIRRLYASRIVVVDEDLQKKVESLEAENGSLRIERANILKIQDNLLMVQANLHEEIRQLKEKPTCLENVALGEMRTCSRELIAASGGCQGQIITGPNFGPNFGGRGYPHCSFVLKDELGVAGARIFDMDASSQILILARRISGMGGMHMLTKTSLIYPYESEDIQLPPGTKAIRDLRISPSGRLALLASLGKKLSVLSMESNNIVITYDLPVPAWSCSWDLNSPNHVYAGLQNGMVLMFDMRQTARPMESMSGLTCHPVHTIHSLLHNSSFPTGVRKLLSASSAGPCVWNIGGVRERPFLVPEIENQSVCISLAYCPSSDDIVATYRPKILMSNETIGSQPSLSPSPTVLGQGIQGSHVLIRRVDGSCYQNLGSMSASVNNVRMPKSAIVNIENFNPLFAYGEEVTRGLSLRELPSLMVAQNLKSQQHPILDVKFAPFFGQGLLGCISEDKLQLFSAKLP